MTEIDTSAEYAEADALPRCHEVHTDADTGTRANGLLSALPQKRPDDKSVAQWAYERLILYIKNFEEGLNGDEEIAMGFAGDSTGVLRIEGMGYFDPDIVTFYGSDTGGAKMQLVQHVSQLSVMLRALPKQQKTEAPRRIGFALVRDLERESAQDREA